MSGVEVGIVGGLLAGALLSNKAKPPKPPTIAPPPVVDPLKAQKAGAQAAKKQKQTAYAAYGSSDTNITGGQLGAVPQINKGYNTLLGGA